MKPILDACCGSKMFWFDKNNPNVEFCDNREVPRHEFYPQRYLEVKPNTVCDFRHLPFASSSFYLVVFDPPHLRHAGKTSWLGIKYGVLESTWQDDLRRGFEECMRVLKDYGVLIFKWSEDQISTADVLKLLPVQPLFGNRRGKTIWMVFMKFPEEESK
ncbi:MAG: methyltransferase [Negativicutes bacterium]